MTERPSGPDPDAFVERVGEFYARLGLPRIAGRLIGWLLICTPEHQSADELCEGIGASRGSISNMLRLCTSWGLVESLGLPGERKRYYRIRPRAWAEALDDSTARFTAMREIAEEGLDVLREAPPEQRTRLEGMKELYSFFEEEFPALIERWEEQQAR